MDETEGHFAKGNKPDTESQLRHNVTYTWNLKQEKVNLIGTKRKKVVARSWGVGETGRGW